MRTDICAGFALLALAAGIAVAGESVPAAAPVNQDKVMKTCMAEQRANATGRTHAQMMKTCMDKVVRMKKQAAHAGSDAALHKSSAGNGNF